MGEEVTMVKLESLSQKAVSLQVDLQNLARLKEDTALGGKVREVARLAWLSWGCQGPAPGSKPHQSLL